MARRWDFISDSRVDGLPTDWRSDVAGRVLDLLGNCLAALSGRPAEAVAATVGEWGGSPQATVIGSATRLPAPSAALVNGTLAHSLDFDDTHLPSVLHPSAAVVPAALAVAEQTDASGPAFCDAMTIGVEATCRLGMAGYDEQNANSVFFDRGQHATVNCGTVGAAVAAGMLRGLSAARRTSAIGRACSMGSGIIEANRTGGTVKRVHCGWAAHAGVEAALRIRRRDVDPAVITELTLGVPEPVLRTIAEPIEDECRPLSGYHGAFSGPYTVADPARFALAARVTPVADPECTRIFPHQFPAVLTVRLADGTVLEERVRHNLGGPENPLSAAELTARFRMNARRAVDDAVAGALAALVTGLAWDIGPTAITGLLRSAT
ncbi:MmgE/PrpD family protein [Streptomyces shenzhenensis]|uniref:MmgE/PrpD family protein n=1 Tax=Streptomyces shenzhenensis TaxID=943815 RepID=UPI0037F81FF6